MLAAGVGLETVVGLDVAAAEVLVEHDERRIAARSISVDVVGMLPRR